MKFSQLQTCDADTMFISYLILKAISLLLHTLIEIFVRTKAPNRLQNSRDSWTSDHFKLPAMVSYPCNFNKTALENRRVALLKKLS